MKVTCTRTCTLLCDNRVRLFVRRRRISADLALRCEHRQTSEGHRPKVDLVDLGIRTKRRRSVWFKCQVESDPREGSAEMLDEERQVITTPRPIRNCG
jgi:hypothetical protein